MRRIAMTALVLLPVLVHAQTNQASTSTAAQASASTTLQAKATPPAGIHPAVPAAVTTNTPAAAAAGDGSDILVPVHENVVQNVPADAQDNGPATYSVLGGDPVVAAQLIHSQPLVLSLKDLRSEPFHAKVVVQVTVDRNGMPRNLVITRSGGDALNKRAIEAVQQYRFKPATQDSLPVESTVQVEIKLEPQAS